MSSKARKSKGAWDTFKTVIYAVLIALVVRTFFFEPFNIPSGSMIPTLLVGDYLFVSKFSYGYSRYSFPFGPDLFSGRILASPPKRGDVFVFKLPSDPSTDYIKRLIGLPGDTIQMREGRLYINGKIVPRERIEDYVYRDESGRLVRAERYIETLPNGVKHPILELGDNELLDNTPVFHVPPGDYFAMGDNRDNSLDSRAMPDGPLHGVGYIPAANLVGKAEILFFSAASSAAWWAPWTWPGAIRLGRFFQVVR